MGMMFDLGTWSDNAGTIRRADRLRAGDRRWDRRAAMVFFGLLFPVCNDPSVGDNRLCERTVKDSVGGPAIKETGHDHHITLRPAWD